MAKHEAALDRSKKEGHGDTAQSGLSVKKGTFLQVGSAVELSQSAISPNRKSGTSSGGEY